ncbi:MAG: anhydro-N-acetylmuramic acid kinase, partial [Proteobacteria bacterium]|nr:anhydro-N-acetylmuramic acid kinase [Pseudomonadota bacterium]
MYIGMLSGTSCDGIDLALVDFSDGIQLQETHFLEYPSDLKIGLLHLIESQAITISQFSQLDARLGQFFSTAVNELIDKAGVKQQNIKAIGSHGQTVFHDPDHRYANSIQIGSAGIIAAQTGISVISQFRQADL